MAGKINPLLRAALSRDRREWLRYWWPWLTLVAIVFWRSGQTKLANWDLTLQLFTNEYKVPVLPPDIAASLAVAVCTVRQGTLCAVKRTGGAAPS